MPQTARYDGHADWYEDWNWPHAEQYAAEIQELLGPGDGLCLDLGCGAGHYFGALAATGRTVVGLDYSADQLPFARRRSRRRAAVRWRHVRHRGHDVAFHRR